jgi:hypothetical protein
MKKMKQIQDNEMDLLSVLLTLWYGKLYIFAFVMLSTLVGLGLFQFAQSKYRVSVPFTLNLFLDPQAVCPQNRKCKTSETHKIINAVSGDWGKIRKSSFSITTTNIKKMDEYNASLKRINDLVTTEAYENANHWLDLINTELNKDSNRSDFVQSIVINSKNIILKIDSGKSVIDFGSVSVVKLGRKLKLYIILSIMLGGMLGIIYVLTSNALRNRREEFKNS